MSEPFVGEIRLFSFNSAPQGWATCDGQVLPISQNQALFSILGDTYGGDGQTTFALPDLRGRTGVHVGGGIVLGQSAGEEQHALTVAEIPAHVHSVRASSATANNLVPAGNLWAASSFNPYGPAPNVNMHPAAIAMTGGGEAHENLQPYLVLNYCIALVGIFPTHN